MPRMIHIEASPRRSRSVSMQLAARFVAELGRRDPSLSVDRLALWYEELPDFDGDALDAKYAVLAGEALTPRQERAWRIIGAFVARLDAADLVLVSTPMWNLGVPYRLKHFIDLVTQPGLSFSFDPGSGYRPLLRPRPAVAILASSGDYSSGESFGRPDLVTAYLRAAFGFIGLSGLEIVPVAPTAGPEAAQAAGRAAAERRLNDLADAMIGAAA